MISLTYVSTAADHIGADELLTMLATIRPKNAEQGLTGVLLYADRNIIQTLEGPAAAVRSTFLAIEKDARHRGVILIYEEEIQDRAFPDWSMGFERYDQTSMGDIPGVTDFLRRRGVAAHATSAERLLEIFRDSTR